MKKVWLLLAAFVLCVQPIVTNAASGTIRVLLPEEVQGAVVQYAKIAEWEEFQEKELVQWLQEDVEYDNSLQVGNNTSVNLTDLEDGIYRVRVSGDETYQFSDAIVSVPTWDEEQKCMQHQITVNPKYSRVTVTPQTGDSSKGVIYIIVGTISLIIIVIMTCNRRFVCGRMCHM